MSAAGLGDRETGLARNYPWVMVRLSLFVVALATLLPAGATAAPEVGALRAFVSLESSAAVAVIDVRSRAVVRRIAVAAGPHNVDATWDGRRVVVTSPPSGRLTVLDGRRLRVLRTVGGLRSPHDARLTENGRWAYVTEQGADTVAIVDVERGRIARRIAVGPRPHDLAVGDVIWVTRSGTRLTVIGCTRPVEPSCSMRPGRLSVLARPDAGGPAHDIDRFPDTADAWFTYWGSPRIGAVRSAVRLVGRPEAVAGAMHLAVDFYSGRRIWVVGEDGDAAVLDRSGRVVRRTRIGGTLHHVALAPARDLVGVVRDSPSTLVLLRRTSGRVVTAVPLGGYAHDVGFALVR